MHSGSWCRYHRVFATLIPDKKQETMIPFILDQVVAGSHVWTDEHRSYRCLTSLGFKHNTLCHKYEFVNQENGVNTQAVESFNNFIKRMIKNENCVNTSKRQRFLNECCFKFNNKNCLLLLYLALVVVTE